MENTKTNDMSAKFGIGSVICRFLCKNGIHNWEHKKGVVNKYYECKRCEKRIVIQNEYVYQPIDRDWLNKQPDSFNHTPPSF
jgi:hypothetical protein